VFSCLSYLLFSFELSCLAFSCPIFVLSCLVVSCNHLVFVLSCLWFVGYRHCALHSSEGRYRISFSCLVLLLDLFSRFLFYFMRSLTLYHFWQVVGIHTNCVTEEFYDEAIQWARESDKKRRDHPEG
jgi:hypothetical protein